MNKLITTNNGGMPFELDDLRWFLGQSASDAGIYQALNNMLGYFGAGTQPNFVINGATGSSSGNDVIVTSGWVYLNGEILYCEGGTATNGNLASDSRVYLTKSTTYDSTGNESFRSGTAYDTYQKNRATINVEQSSAYVRPDSAAELTIWFDDDTEILNYLNRIMVERLPTASSTGNGVVQTATNLETQTGTSTTKVVTCAGLQSKVASTTDKGIVRLATVLEAKGSSNELAVTPSGLSNRLATDTSEGLIAIASDSDFLDPNITDEAIVPSNFNQEWTGTTGNLSAVDTENTLNSRSIYYIHLGRILFITINLDITTKDVGAQSNLELEDTSSPTDYAHLQPRRLGIISGQLYDGSNYEAGYCEMVGYADDPSVFKIRMRKSDGSTFSLDTTYEFYGNGSYETQIANDTI